MLEAISLKEDYLVRLGETLGGGDQVATGPGGGGERGRSVRPLQGGGRGALAHLQWTGCSSLSISTAVE